MRRDRFATALLVCWGALLAAWLGYRVVTQPGPCGGVQDADGWCGQALASDGTMPEYLAHQAKPAATEAPSVIVGRRAKGKPRTPAKAVSEETLSEATGRILAAEPWGKSGLKLTLQQCPTCPDGAPLDCILLSGALLRKLPKPPTPGQQWSFSGRLKERRGETCMVPRVRDRAAAKE